MQKMIEKLLELGYEFQCGPHEVNEETSAGFYAIFFDSDVAMPCDACGLAEFIWDDCSHSESLEDAIIKAAEKVLEGKQQ